MRKRNGRILLVEEGSNLTHSVLWAISEILPTWGFVGTEASGAVEALEQARRQPFDAMLTDIRIQETGGPLFLQVFKRLQPATPMIVINTFGTAEAATEAMRAGAFTYITWPFSAMDVRSAIDQALCRMPSAGTIRPEGGLLGPSISLVGHSRAMAGVEWALAQAAMSKTPILIEGERGTGKGLVARSIHRLSDRASGPFVKIRCADLPDEVLERLLFGCDDAISRVSAPGSLQTAAGGTLVLDEVDSLGLVLQDRLMALLGDSGPSHRVGVNGSNPPDVRILSTSRADVLSLVHRDRFRMNLHRRLAAVKITIPPLRDRREDIPILVEHVLRELGDRTNKTVEGVSPEAMERLRLHDWPGNVGELREVIERAFIVATTSTIRLEDLPAAMQMADACPSKRAEKEPAIHQHSG